MFRWRKSELVGLEGMGKSGYPPRAEAHLNIIRIDILVGQVNFVSESKNVSIQA
jgi:hypothetical protein